MVCLPYSCRITGERDCGVRVQRSLSDKVAAFCRELGDSALRDMARVDGKEPVFLRAEKALTAGQIDAALEADLDRLDEMVRSISKGLGLYSGSVRAYQPLPGDHGGTGARWWTCPAGRCSGRGRVRPGDKALVCAVTGEQLVPGPLPE
jgi:hypothetical protein